jgi:Protein of unknown function (DUF433)
VVSSYEEQDPAHNSSKAIQHNCYSSVTESQTSLKVKTHTKMNTKLVESLVQVIESLPPEDYILLQGQLTARNIQKTAGVCGGYARIRNTRIPVWTIISL